MMVIIGSDKAKLHAIRKCVARYLQRNLHLELKDNWQVFRLGNGFIDFMGYKFYKNRTTIRKTIFFRAVRKARRMRMVTWYNSSKMLSYLGWLAHSNCYGAYLDWVKPFVSVKELKKRISLHQRRVNDEIRLAKLPQYTETAGCCL